MKKYQSFYALALRGLFAACLLLIHLYAGEVQAQNCNPDVTPPVAVCNQSLVIAVSTNGLALLDASFFDAGSSDNCCLGSIKLRRDTDGLCDSDTLPDTFTDNVLFCCADIGTPLTIRMRVFDCTGNYTDCWTAVEVEDKTPPTCTPPANVTVNCDDFDPTYAVYGLPTAADACCVDTILVNTNTSQLNTACLSGSVTRNFIVSDCSGNTAACSHKITVLNHQYYYVRFPDDRIITQYTPGADHGSPVFGATTCEAFAASYSDVVYTTVPEADLLVERTWSIINWCYFDPNQPNITVPNPTPDADFFSLSNLAGPVVAPSGTAAPWTPTVAKLTPNAPAPTDFSTYWNANVGIITYTQRLWVIDTFFVGVQGTMYSDTTANCTYDTGEPLLEAWEVQVTGLVTGEEKTVLTDASGFYHVEMSGLDTALNVSFISSANLGQNCPTSYNISVPLGQVASQDLPVHLEQRCALLSVDISTPRLRRCMQDRYTVQACNLSAEQVNAPYVDVTLDDQLTYAASSATGVSLGNNTYRFQLADLAPGECTNFTIDVQVSCNAILGATHCTEARIYPVQDCRSNANWSGADVDVSAYCDGDSVRLKITNIGDGSMAQMLDFVVVEDIIMRHNDQFQLGVGESLSLAYKADGSTWRIQADEEPYHPFAGGQYAVVEGCGGLNTPGLVNLLPVGNPSPFNASDCHDNIGSFDPNDKQAFPTGIGSEHRVHPNTDIEYQIRFQNTGTDTASKVVILDTLSFFLDPATVRVGAASHPMEFALLPNGVLRFTFSQIMLPDSNTNLEGSKGYVNFRVSQRADNQLGTVIPNEAAIYFDFNTPVITNTTFHTVSQDLLLVRTTAPAPIGFMVFPNPANEEAWFRFDAPLSQAQFELQNPMGQTVRQVQFSGSNFRLERRELPAGIYLFKIQDMEGGVATGKIMLR